MTKILVVVLLLVCLVAGWALWARGEPVGDGPGPATRAAPSPGPAPAVPTGPPVAATRPAPRTPKMFRLPDGSQAAMLNGVVELPPNPWPADMPYSRILGKETDASGLEWYVHADGTKSTMQNTWRSDLGREDSIFRVFSPVPVVPTVGGAGAAPTGSRPTGR